MTVDAYVAAPGYTIAGAGPYAVPFDYLGAGDLVVIARTTAGDVSLMPGFDFTASPAGPATSGSVTLGAAAAVTHAGATLLIARATAVEQGWAAQGGAREAGLEAQLDRTILALQDAGRRQDDANAATARALRLPPGAAALPEITAATWANRFVFIAADGRPVPVSAQPLSAAAENRIVGAAPDVATLTFAAEVDWIETLGGVTPGDGGRGVYVERESAPTHPARLQCAAGRHWELAGREARLETFGAVAGGYADDALADAAEWSAETGGTVIIDRIFKLATQVTLTADNYGFRGPGGNRKFALHAGFRCDPGAGVRFKRGDGSQNQNNLTWVGIGMWDEGTSTAPANRRSWDAVPLLEVWRCSQSRIMHSVFDGRDRRRRALWLGRGSCFFNGWVVDNEIGYSQIGVQQGGDWLDPTGALGNDATACAFLRNTVHHCKTVGGAFYNAKGWMIAANTFENNQGPLAVALLCGGNDRSSGTTIRSNYMRSFSTDAAVETLESAVVGLNCDVPWSDFEVDGTPTLTRNASFPCWQIDVSHNDMPDVRRKYAVLADVDRYSRIVANGADVAAVSGAAGVHLLTDFGNTTEIWGNVDNSAGVPLPVTSAGATWWQPPFMRDAAFDLDARAGLAPGALRLGVLGGGGETSASPRAVRQIAGTGGAWVTILEPSDLDDERGVVEVLVSVKQTNDHNQSVHAVRYATPLRDSAGDVTVAADYEVAWSSPSAAVDGQQWRISGDALQLYRVNTWLATVSTAAAVIPHA